MKFFGYDYSQGGAPSDIGSTNYDSQGNVIPSNDILGQIGSVFSNIFTPARTGAIIDSLTNKPAPAPAKTGVPVSYIIGGAVLLGAVWMISRK